MPSQSYAIDSKNCRGRETVSDPRVFMMAPLGRRNGQGGYRCGAVP
jgi:hypothetical protein